MSINAFGTPAPGSPQAIAINTIVGVMAAYEMEHGISDQEDYLAIAHRIYNMGFRQVGTEADQAQNKRLEQLETAIATLRGWVGPVTT